MRNARVPRHFARRAIPFTSIQQSTAFDMVRIGTNPMKAHDQGVLWQPVTFVTAVHIPSLTGYWKESLNVLKVCLASLQLDQSVPFDVLVVNNGSCDEVHQYLEEALAAKTIHFLLHSSFNLGKGGALNAGLTAAPGQYLAYADCDVMFSPGWLKASLRLMDTFPRVGMVTARPNRSRKSWGKGSFQSTFDSLSKRPDVAIESGQFIDKAILDDHAQSLGYAPDAFEDFDCDDTLVEHNGVFAYVGAYHFQFLTTKEAASQILPLEVSGSLAVGPDHAWDERMNQLGYLKLTLTEPLCRHLGNSLQGESQESLLGGSGANPESPRRLRQAKSSSWLTSLLRLFLPIPKMRGVYTRLYRTLFEVISS